MAVFPRGGWWRCSAIYSAAARQGAAALPSGPGAASALPGPTYPHRGSAGSIEFTLSSRFQVRLRLRTEILSVGLFSGQSTS